MMTKTSAHAVPPTQHTGNSSEFQIHPLTTTFIDVLDIYIALTVICHSSSSS